MASHSRRDGSFQTGANNLLFPSHLKWFDKRHYHLFWDLSTAATFSEFSFSTEHITGAHQPIPQDMHAPERKAESLKCHEGHLTSGNPPHSARGFCGASVFVPVLCGALLPDYSWTLLFALFQSSFSIAHQGARCGFHLFSCWSSWSFSSRRSLRCLTSSCKLFSELCRSCDTLKCSSPL